MLLLLNMEREDTGARSLSEPGRAQGDILIVIIAKEGEAFLFENAGNANVKPTCHIARGRSNDII